MVYRPKYIDRETGERKTAATWWIQFSVRGVRYRQSSRSINRADAVRLLKHRLGEAADGRPIGPQIERTTFDDLVRILLDNYRANGRRSLRRVEGGVKHLREFFGDYRAVDITEDRLSAYIVYRKQQDAANATINRELAALKRAFRLASRKVGQPPRFQMLSENNARKGFFEKERTHQLELATGRVIPWVFHRDGAPIHDYYGAWDKACRLAGLADRLVHDLRRTAVRNLERASVSRSAAMKMTGHKTESVYRRYAIVDETMLREGAEKLAAYHSAHKGRGEQSSLSIRTIRIAGARVSFREDLNSVPYISKA